MPSADPGAGRPPSRAFRLAVPFRQIAKGHKPLAGGKGKTLARLFQTGYRIPDGFIILTRAFDGDEPTKEAWVHIRGCLARLRRGNPKASFAVRSSALAEDSAETSFAGEFETILDAVTDDEIRDAIRAVRHSRRNARVEAYSSAQGLGDADHEIAVIVQYLIRADISGVLFTVDPVSGSLSRMMGNCVHGAGEKLVSGTANSEAFTFARPVGRYDGPQELGRSARELYRIACALEKELEDPQDIEWAIAGGRLYILQSRPITTLSAFTSDTCEWNASRTGRFLWSATNLAEQAPEVRTPFSCSLLDIHDSIGAFSIGRHRATGIIGGRAYSNLSVMLTAYLPLFGGDAKRAAKMLTATFGDIPEDIDIPIVPISRPTWWTRVLPGILGYVMKMQRLKRRIPRFVVENPGRCGRLRETIGQITDRPALSALWQNEIRPYFLRGLLLLYASTIDISPRLERKLRSLVGPEDADILLSNLSGLSGGLESLGPVAGIGKVASGAMSREAYLEAYGHRGVNEFEYAWPRPMEDPAWLDRQIAELTQSTVDVEALFARQRASYDAAWERFTGRYPRMAKGMRSGLMQAAGIAQRREAIRSEVIRIMAVIRAFALRAGKLAGIGDDVFFLTIDEVCALLEGHTDSLRHIPLRRTTHERYRALPQYPGIILGRFNPFSWAADPRRRSDVFVDDAPPAQRETASAGMIKGLAGAPGIGEGNVRRIDRVEESDQFQAGEVLVTSMTNIGWTLIFPRAAAVVTDIGAPLSHASIVARELGIPAVVGCGDATSRLKTGDRVRVDGGRGIVEIIAAP
jgi:rifampicin phosphotransferase